MEVEFFELVLAVEKMRQAQNAYFRTSPHDKETKQKWLKESKGLEAAVDFRIRLARNNYPNIPNPNVS